MWVRDFTISIAPYMDINRLTPEEVKLYLNNEMANRFKKLDRIDGHIINHANCVIVSDGYQFEEKQALLAKLPKDVIIIGVNGSLKKWDLKHKKAMNYYVANNPYPEAMWDIPTKHRYWPKAIVSSRTYPKFIDRYDGFMHSYIPSYHKEYDGPIKHTHYRIDDYKNPICAAIGLAYRFGINKLLLLCCDESFEKERSGSIQLENGLWTYPPHKEISKIIDGSLHFLTHQETKKVEVIDHSSNFKYSNATYIKEEEELIKFFENDE
jgi:hypothetical protein